MDFADVRQWASLIDECSSIGQWLFPFSRDALFADPLVGSKEFYEVALDFLARTPDLNPGDVATSFFAVKALRKWRLPATGIDARTRAEEAYQSFIQRNALAKVQCTTSLPPEIAYLMRDALQRWLPYPDGFVPIGKFGPGACYERWDHTKRAAKLSQWINASEHWPEVPTGHADFQRSVARLCAVPKDWYRDRLITVESAYSTYAQAYVRELLQASIHMGPLSGTCMDLGYVDGQVIQRKLALHASKDGDLATLDLKDASDGIHVEDVVAVFPPWVCDLLLSTRSEEFVHEGYRDRLAFYAGMGNGTTFTVETLYFTALCYAFARRYGIVASPRGRRHVISVFGDDIVCPSMLAAKLVEITGDLPCFKINKLKSFWGDTRFREACGIFAYQGVDITCPRIDGVDDSYEGDFALAELHSRCQAMGGLSLGFSLLAHRIAEAGRLANWPFYVEGFPSVQDWSVAFSRLPATRYNPRLQRREARVLVDEARGRYFPLSDAQGVYPKAQTWLVSALAGQLTTRMYRGRPCAYVVERDAPRRSRWKWLRVVQSWPGVESPGLEVFTNQ